MSSDFVFQTETDDEDVIFISEKPATSPIVVTFDQEKRRALQREIDQQSQPKFQATHLSNKASVSVATQTIRMKVEMEEDEKLIKKEKKRKNKQETNSSVDDKCTVTKKAKKSKNVDKVSVKKGEDKNGEMTERKKKKKKKTETDSLGDANSWGVNGEEAKKMNKVINTDLIEEEVKKKKKKVKCKPENTKEEEEVLVEQDKKPKKFKHSTVESTAEVEIPIKEKKKKKRKKSISFEEEITVTTKKKAKVADNGLKLEMCDTEIHEINKKKESTSTENGVNKKKKVKHISERQTQDTDETSMKKKIKKEAGEEKDATETTGKNKKTKREKHGRVDHDKTLNITREKSTSTQTTDVKVKTAAATDETFPDETEKKKKRKKDKEMEHKNVKDNKMLNIKREKSTMLETTEGKVKSAAASEEALPVETEKKKKKRKKDKEMELLSNNCEGVEEKLSAEAADPPRKKKSSAEIGAKMKKKKIKVEEEEPQEASQVDVVFLSSKKGNTDEITINKERRRELQMQVDEASQPQKPSKPTGLGQWGTAQFNSSEQQHKFLRLMGGFKKGVQPAASSPGAANMALGKDAQQQLHKGLLGEFERAHSRRMDFSQRAAGLGFSAPSNKKFSIDVDARRSVRFDD